MGLIHVQGQHNKLIPLPPSIYGYTDLYTDNIEHIDVLAGDRNCQAHLVDDGYLWMVDSMAAVNQSSACSSIVIFLYSGGNYVQVGRDGTPAAARWLNVNGLWVLSPGQFLIAYFYGCLLNDDIFFRVHGWKNYIG